MYTVQKNWINPLYLTHKDKHVNGVEKYSVNCLSKYLIQIIL